MKIDNRTTTKLDTAALEFLAGSLGLGGALPAAQRDGLFLFDDEEELIVQLIATRNPPAAGDYTCGKMRIFVCPRCSVGRVIWVFAHELVHAWYESYHWECYCDPGREAVADLISWYQAQYGDLDSGCPLFPSRKGGGSVAMTWGQAHKVLEAAFVNIVEKVFATAACAYLLAEADSVG